MTQPAVGPRDTLPLAASFLSLSDQNSLSCASKGCQEVVRHTRLTYDLPTIEDPNTYMGRHIQRIVSLDPALMESEEWKIELLAGIRKMTVMYLAKPRGTQPSFYAEWSYAKLNTWATMRSDTKLLVGAADIFQGTNLTLNDQQPVNEKVQIIREWVATHIAEIGSDMLERIAGRGNNEIMQTVLNGRREFSSEELFSCLLRAVDQAKPEIVQIILASRHEISSVHLDRIWSLAAMNRLDRPETSHQYAKIIQAIERSGRPFSKCCLRLNQALDRAMEIPLVLGSYVVMAPGVIVNTVGYGVQEAYFAAQRVFERCRRPHQH